MRRVIAIAVTGASLAGCSSFSLDSFKSAPPLVKVALESAPPGADATTSLGPACKTPCSIDVPAPDAGFSVTFAMPQVPAGHGSGPGDPQSRRFCLAGDDHHRAQPGVRGTPAGGAAAEGAQADAAEEAEATQGGRGAGPCPRAARHALIPLPLLRASVADCRRPSKVPRLCQRRRGQPRAETSKAGYERFLVDFIRSAVPADGRSVRPDHPVSARVGDRSLRPALLLLHVRGHDLPAESRSADAGRTRPAVLGLHRQGRAQDPPHRRRAAGPAQRDVAGALAVAASFKRRAR